MEKFDLVVIFGGPGKYAAAICASQQGASVALIEKEALGGTCLNWECIPTKTLIASSKFFTQMKNSKKMGLNWTEANLDYNAMSKHKDKLVRKLRSGIADLLKANRIAVFKCTGSFENAVMEKRRWKETIVPACIFTSPEVGTVGLTETEARKLGIAVKIGKFPFSALGKVLTICNQSGFVKWVVDADTEQLLGAHAIGPHATDLVAEDRPVTIRAELTVHELEHTIHCHPTLTEAWMEAAYAVQDKSIHLMPRKIRSYPDIITKNRN